MIALMIVPEYATLLHIEYQATSYFLGILGVCVAISSVICGHLSGDHIRPQFIPWGAGGMSLCLLALVSFLPLTKTSVGWWPGWDYPRAFTWIPLQSLMQYLSPRRNGADTWPPPNALSFVFVSAGAIVYWLASQFMPPNRVHLVAGAIAAMGTYVGIVRLIGSWRNGQRLPRRMK